MHENPHTSYDVKNGTIINTMTTFTYGDRSISQE